MTEKEKILTENQLRKYEKRRGDLTRKLNEEKELISTLRELVKKYNKEITNTNAEKDRLRVEYLKSEKMKE